MFFSGTSFAQNKAEAITFNSENFDKETAVIKLKSEIKNEKVFKIIKKDIVPEKANSGNGDSEEENSKWDFDSISVDHFSPVIQSVVIIVESYLGPSGSTNFYNYTFNVKTGQIYSLADLFKPGCNWAHVIWPYVKNALVSEGITRRKEMTSRNYAQFSLDSKTLYLDFGFCELLPCVRARTYTIPIPLQELSFYLSTPFQSKSQ
jgi:hypothetical protein